MLLRPFAFLITSTVCSVALLGCGGDSSESPDAPFTAWIGPWRATETYMRSSAFNPVAEAIREMRPEYTAEEIKEIFAAGHDVDFTDLVVSAGSLTFTDATRVVCAGRYEAGTRHEDGHDGDEHDEHGATFTFHLVETLGGDCSAYATVAFGSDPQVLSDRDGEYAHFHLQAGAPRPAPWSPAVLTPISAERFTETQLANASAYALGLPPK
jgi:Zn/Cd-binding protein ZinT